MSPYSALSLVRHRIHALRQFTELLMKLTYLLHEGRLGSPYSALCLVQLRIHALRQSTWLGIFTEFLREGGLGPCGPAVWSFFSAVAAHRQGRGAEFDELDFLGPCTHVQGRGSCPLGHGPHN